MNIQKQKEVGDIVKFKLEAVDDGAVAVEDFLYNKKMNTWNERNILKDQNGIILEVRSIEIRSNKNTNIGIKKIKKNEKTIFHIFGIALKQPRYIWFINVRWSISNENFTRSS